MDLKKRVGDAVTDSRSLDGMRRSFKTIRDRQAKNAPRIPDLDARKDRLRKVKEASVGDMELLQQAMSTLRENGFRVVLAKTREGALRAIGEEVKGQRLVVKSKSNVTKDLHLAEHLGTSRNNVHVIRCRDLGKVREDRAFIARLRSHLDG